MSNIRDVLVKIQDHFETTFNASGTSIEDSTLSDFNQGGWINLAWTSEYYRKACISVIDVTDSKGLWMMHCCIFPHYHNPAPIFGFDVFAGKNKITGCFHDFSPVITNHFLSQWFAEQSNKLFWNSKRQLPEWAIRIFSENIIAAGNVKTDDELNQIIKFVTSSLEMYLQNIGDTNNSVEDISNTHIEYCQNQRLNPHNPTMLKTLGLTDNQVQLYINHCLFPIN